MPVRAKRMFQAMALLIRRCEHTFKNTLNGSSPFRGCHAVVPGPYSSTGEASATQSATRIAPATQITLPTVRGYLAVAVATLLLISGSVVAWRVYDGWRQGRIELTTDGEPVVGQVLAESSDDPIGEPFDLVSRAVLSLPAGEYRLRVTGKGRLSRTYRFAVNRGETQSIRSRSMRGGC